MKKGMMSVAAMLAMIGSAAFATDFSSMTTEQLQAMRGKVPAAEREAFRAEMQKRMRESNGDALGQQNRMRKGSGNGQGKMYRKGMNR